MQDRRCRPSAIHLGRFAINARRLPVPSATPTARPKAPKPRSTLLTVELGELKAQLQARSAADGVSPSAWVREAILGRLEAHAEASEAIAERRPQSATAKPLDGQAPVAAQGVDSARGAGVYRAWFDAEQTAKLDVIVARTGRRSRIKALHALLDGVQVGAEASAGNLGDAVQALARSNHELVAIGRNLNQVAKSLNAYPGKTTVADRMAIERVLATLRGHLEDAARLVAELRPTVKTKPGGGGA